MTCRLCLQEMVETKVQDGLHLERAPIDASICLGCFIATVEVETWLLRSGIQRICWTLKVQDAMKELLEKFQ